MTWLGDRVPHAAFVAANSGSTVWERTDDEWTLLAHRSLGAEQVSEIVATAEAAGIEVWAHTERDWIARERTPRVQRDESFVGDTALLEDAAGRDDVGKLLLLSSHPSHEPVARSLAALPGVAAVSSSEIFMDLVPEASAAGKGGDVLVDRLGIGWDEVIAIGDGVCDVTMLQLAGVGIAMGNAEDSVKACVDKTTLTNEEEGVAVAVERTILAEIRPTEVPLDQLNMRARHALMGNLGIQYTYASEDRVEATMPVDERTRQPFGILHGGATLALAETVAGLGSMILAKPDEIVVGMQVSGNHMSSAHEGDTVRAVGTIIHKGRSSHVWNVDVFTSTDKLVSSIRVVNSILKKK